MSKADYATREMFRNFLEEPETALQYLIEGDLEEPETTLQDLTPDDLQQCLGDAANWPT